jgi:hypothetical protein
MKAYSFNITVASDSLDTDEVTSFVSASLACVTRYSRLYPTRSVITGSEPQASMGVSKTCGSDLFYLGKLCINYY